MPAANPKIIIIRYIEKPNIAQSFLPNMKNTASNNTSRVETSTILSLLPWILRE